MTWLWQHDAVLFVLGIAVGLLAGAVIALYITEGKGGES